MWLGRTRRVWNTLLRYKASGETSHSGVFRSFMLTALMSEWTSSPYSDRESSDSWKVSDMHSSKAYNYDVHRSSDGRDCGGLCTGLGA